MKQVETMIDIQRNYRNRKTVFWRWILVAPMALFAGTFEQLFHWGWSISGFLVIPVVLALIFRGIYPSYALHLNHALLELNTRIATYIFLLNDDFPSIERNPRVAVVLPDIAGGRALHRALPLVKWILAIPLIIVGIIYSVAAAAVTIVAWVKTFSTGEYPDWAIDVIFGTIAYWNRVFGYALLLVTDEYPSFSL